jgi:hypothetical protein
MAKCWSGIECDRPEWCRHARGVCSRDLRDRSKYRNLYERVPELAQAIVIGRSSSSCGACGRDANPHDKSHDVVVGYFAANLPEDSPERIGCHTEFEYVTSDYSGEDQKQACMEMRPDLEWIDMYPDSPARR